VRPTSITTLVALFVGLATATWGALDLVENRGGVLPPIGPTAPAGVFALAVVVLIAALSVRSRLRSDDVRRRPHPLAMARMVVFGKASAHLGPIVGGLYAGYGLVLLPDLDIESRRDRAVLALFAVLAAALLALAGLLLERFCRVPGGVDDDDPSALA
jgi:uncharacterized protein DUF3180